MVCLKCGNIMDDNTKFCTKCGESIIMNTSVPTNNQTSPYTYNNVKKKPSLTPNQGGNKPKKKKFGFLIAIACLVIIAILVQVFAYPFLLQKISFGRISTVALKTVDPEKNYDEGVKDSEIKSVVSYAAGLRRSLSWQLSGREKKVFSIASRYLEEAPLSKEINAAGKLKPGSAVTLLASSSPDLMLLSDNSSREYSKEEIASDLSGIASMLLQRGYTKLAIALTALATESSPVDPLIINNLTCALRADGHTQDAYKLLGYAYKLCPDSPEILTNMGNVCLDQGDADLAGTWFDMAISIDDDFGLAHEGLMLCYMNQERYEVAMRHMIKASETTFTPAIYRAYERISNLEEYEDEIRDNVLKGFEFSDIQKTYKRTRDQAHEGIDTPSGQIKIPKFPMYSNVEAFIGGVAGMHDYAMSIFTPAMDELKKLGEMAKQAEDLIKSFESGGLSGLMGSAKGMGLLNGAENGTPASINGGSFQLSMDYSRELYTMSLLGDYLDMKVKEPLEEMQEKLEKSGDPLLQAGERSMREIESRGESEEAWLSAMANNWGSSMALNSSTISANKANINQHINEFYQAITPAYNEIKPLLEEYWLYAGGVIKYAGDENVFKSLESMRKTTLYGNLAIFAIHAELEAINVPLAYASYAVQGDPPTPDPEEQAEKLEKPEEEVPMPEETFSLDFGIIECEWSDGELEVEVTALVAASVKYNHQKGTVTMAGGVGVSTGDFVPMLGGKATATYYVVISKSGVNDHGLATKTEYSVGEGVKYKVKETSTISSVTSAMDTTVEKAVVGGKIFTAGFKRSESQ